MVRITYRAPREGPRMVLTLKHTFFGQNRHLVRKKTSLREFLPQIWSGFNVGPLPLLSGVLCRSSRRYRHQTILISTTRFTVRRSLPPSGPTLGSGATIPKESHFRKRQLLHTFDDTPRSIPVIYPRPSDFGAVHFQNQKLPVTNS